MSQLVACTCPDGVILASDRRVIRTLDGEEQVHSLRKLFPLGETAVLATSGAAVGIEVSRTLSRLLRKGAVPPFGALETYVMEVFQKEYDEFVHQGETWFAAHPQAHRLSYVLLGGRMDGDQFGFRFFASEAHGQPYQPWRPGSALTAPRRLGLESRLAWEAANGYDLDAIAEQVLTGLRAVARHEDSVAGPFDVAILSRSGTRLATFY